MKKRLKELKMASKNHSLTFAVKITLGISALALTALYYLQPWLNNSFLMSIASSTASFILPILTFIVLIELIESIYSHISRNTRTFKDLKVSPLQNKLDPENIKKQKHSVLLQLLQKQENEIPLSDSSTQTNNRSVIQDDETLNPEEETSIDVLTSTVKGTANPKNKSSYQKSTSPIKQHDENIPPNCWDILQFTARSKTFHLEGGVGTALEEIQLEFNKVPSMYQQKTFELVQHIHTYFQNHWNKNQETIDQLLDIHKEKPKNMQNRLIKILLKDKKENKTHSTAAASISTILRVVSDPSEAKERVICEKLNICSETLNLINLMFIVAPVEKIYRIGGKTIPNAIDLAELERYRQRINDLCRSSSDEESSDEESSYEESSYDGKNGVKL